MPQIELHRGPYWARAEFQKWAPEGISDQIMENPDIKEWIVEAILQRFHDIARQNGSMAVWLSQAGTLITTDGAEPEKGFRYYLWRKQAINATIADLEQYQPKTQNSTTDSVIPGTSLKILTK